MDFFFYCTESVILPVVIGIDSTYFVNSFVAFKFDNSSLERIEFNE